jgi:tRNA-specific 2-thiouridylase
MERCLILGIEGINSRSQRPQRAIARGQICALYEGGRLLGGGVFESVE